MGRVGGDSSQAEREREDWGIKERARTGNDIKTTFQIRVVAPKPHDEGEKVGRLRVMLV